LGDGVKRGAAHPKTVVCPLLTLIDAKTNTFDMKLKLREPDHLSDKEKISELSRFLDKISAERYNHSIGNALLALLFAEDTLKSYKGRDALCNEYVKSIQFRIQKIFWWNDKALISARTPLKQ
jgi:hypothetical protein